MPGRRLALGLLCAALPMQAAQAFDCAKAATGVERLICADPGLKALDDRMGQAYAQVRDLTPKDGRAMLGQAQKAWIMEREGCSGGDDPAVCVKDSTRARLALLLGGAASGPGTPTRIVPRFIMQTGTDSRYEIDATLLRMVAPASPGEKRLNRLADALAADIPFGPHGDEPNPYYDYILDQSLDYLSPAFASVAISISSYTGGAHPNSTLWHVNIDMASGRDLGIGDLFDGATLEGLAAECRSQIIAEKTARVESGQTYDPQDDRFLQDDTVRSSVGDISRWSFTDREGRLDFDPYAIGAYAEGRFACSFAMAALRGASRPGAPLP